MLCSVLGCCIIRSHPFTLPLSPCPDSKLHNLIINHPLWFKQTFKKIVAGREEEEGWEVSSETCVALLQRAGATAAHIALALFKLWGTWKSRPATVSGQEECELHTREICAGIAHEDNVKAILRKPFAASPLLSCSRLHSQRMYSKNRFWSRIHWFKSTLAVWLLQHLLSILPKGYYSFLSESQSHCHSLVSLEMLIFGWN